jgi:hypothetical protein
MPSNSGVQVPSILVVGDIVNDYLVFSAAPESTTTNYNWQRYDHISRGISWERTATDFALQLDKRWKFLRQCRHVLVRFGHEAVLHYYNEKKEGIRIFYDPAHAEGEYGDEYEGKMLGSRAVFCVSLAVDISNSNFKTVTAKILASYIPAALVASRRLLQFGFGADQSDLRVQHEEIFSRSAASRQFAVSTVPIKIRPAMQDARSWSFLQQASGSKLPNLAERIVLDGKLPPEQFGVPMARFGDLQTMDRSEIESYRSIRNLFREFLAAKDVARPLSIAVFGQPGSGKSFGITEVAKSLDSEAVEQGLVFNVAQFTSEKDLIDALHAVRDVALRGKVPLVFFDEFDSTLNEPLAWLKYFLAPMQDGKFKDGDAP